MAEKLAVALERGWHFRRAGHSTVRRIMDAGARGCQVVISGKLTGQRHRTEKFKEGHIKHCGDPKNKFMRKGFAVATLKLGIIGVKVQIMDQMSRLPDDIEVQKEAVKTTEEAPAEVPVEIPVETAEEGEAAEGEEAVAKPEAEAKAEAEPEAEVKAEPGAAAEAPVETKPEKAKEPVVAAPVKKEKR
jgi:small subunit ribosomal protein S3